MSRIIRVGFCGAGGIVRSNHKPNLEARENRYAIAGFYDIRQENAEKTAQDRYPTYATYEELLATDVDLVVIATKPLTTHFPLAKQALEADKHVLLEKPMASTSEECDALIHLAREKKRLLTVHHNRRLDLDFLALQHVLERNSIGEPRFIDNRKNSGSYEPADFVDWGVHLVDQALLLNRSALTEVSAFLCHPDQAVEQGGYGEVTLRFAKPPVVRVSMLPRTKEFLLNGTPPVVRFYAAGTTGAFAQRTIEDLRDLMNATQNFDQAKPEYAVPPYLQIQQQGYYDFLHESLTADAPLLVQPEEARNAIRVLELMAESARGHRSVEATNMLDLET